MDRLNENKEIVDSFISEGLDLIDNAEVRIGEMEKSNDQEIVNTIFRMFHSIKGSAGFLEFDVIKGVTHEAETLLDIFRKKKTKPSGSEIDLLYQTCDFLKQLIMNVEKNLSDKEFAGPANLVIRDIRDAIESIREDFQKTAENPAVPAEIIGGIPVEAATPVKTDSATEAAGQTGEEALVEPAEIADYSLESLISPEMIDRYVSESLDTMDLLEQLLLDLEKKPNDIELVSEIFRKVHSFKGNSGFMGYMPLEELAMESESLLDSVRSEKMVVSHQMVSVLLAVTDYLRRSIGVVREKGNAGLDLDAKNSLLESIRSVGATPKARSGILKPLGEILVDMGAVSRVVLDEALDLQKKKVGQILVENGSITDKAVEEALEIQKKLAPSTGAESFSSGYQRKDIRVDMSKLDKLFNLIGELITAEEMVTRNPELSGLIVPSFTKSANYLNKITRELQEISTSIRMLPLEGLFNKMTRLVRDLSRKFAKDIDLSIAGAETEMDRNVIEEISDPLVHILRNAIDHGIERREKRRETGKSETGKIHLEAKYEGNEIWISIEDDGGGLDRAKILSKAAERGILSRDPELMSDADVWQIIFEPGFSTADLVTDVSGRGVGMDVVKKNIEKIRGKIEIQSNPGKGSRFILKIPLTLAILDGINIRIGANQYSIPIADIVESFKVKQSQITVTEGEHEVIRVRDEIIPVIRLHRLFRVKGAVELLTEGILMVVQSSGKKAAFLLDEIVGNQQIVIKSLSNYFGNVKGIMGCSIMGSGEVSLILDVGGLINGFI